LVLELGGHGKKQALAEALAADLQLIAVLVLVANVAALEEILAQLLHDVRIHIGKVSALATAIVEPDQQLAFVSKLGASNRGDGNIGTLFRLDLGNHEQVVVGVGEFADRDRSPGIRLVHKDTADQYLVGEANGHRGFAAFKQEIEGGALPVS